MEYTIKKLAGLSGVSTRTLRYYDEIGLLKPARIASNGYRIYGTDQVDTLQQILFYRAMEVPLEEIRQILTDGAFDPRRTLQEHLEKLCQRKAQLEQLMETVRKTIQSMEGEGTMTDQEKFAGLKQQFMTENQKQYGAELEERYGKAVMNRSNEKVAALTGEQWQDQEQLSAGIAQQLRAAMEIGDPSCPAAQEACELHRQWLMLFWPEGTYSKEAHRSMGEMYVADPRFRTFYEGIAPGCAVFFRDALAVYCEKP